MSNSVPEGWDFEQLGDYVSDSAAGEWGDEAQGDQNDIPVLRSTNFTESGIIDYTKLAFRNIEEKKRIKKALKKGDILLEKSGGSPAQPVGRVVYFDRDTPHLFSNFTQKLVPVKDCDSKYLFYKLYFEYQNGTVLKFQQQTTGIINFQLAEYLGFKTIFAPLPEQQKIAAILSSVDDVIEKTRTQIGKLKDLKIGMMQELLTKGIGHTEFKDSPVGRIPVSWEVCTLGDLTKDSAFGPRFSSDFYSETGNFGCIRTTDMDENWDIDYSTVPLALLNFNEFQSHILRDGDLLVTRSGTCGVVDVFQEQPVPMVAAAFLIRFRLLDSVNPWFVRSVMMSTSTQESIQMLASGGVQKNLSGTNLKTLPLPLPSKEEQDEIVHCINSVSKRITLIEEKKDRLTSLKKALMQDLLTGKVRVNIDQKESAVA
jgi:type I restriction enzyme S subunit